MQTMKVLSLFSNCTMSTSLPHKLFCLLKKYPSLPIVLYITQTPLIKTLTHFKSTSDVNITCFAGVSLRAANQITPFPRESHYVGIIDSTAVYFIWTDSTEVINNEYDHRTSLKYCLQATQCHKQVYLLSRILS